jgi:two-component system, OmpR family, sensor kinase
VKIRTRLLLFLVVVVGCVLAMAGEVWLTVRETDRILRRVQWAHEQLEAITELAVELNRYSEQIAEVLLLGNDERPDFDEARAGVEAALAKLDRVTRGERLFLRGDPEQEAELDEIERAAALRALFHEIDRAAERVFLLKDQGDVPSAIALYRSNIEERLDADMEKRIREAIEDERGEVERATAEAQQMSRRLVIAGAVLAVVTALLALAAALALGRSILRPLRRLAAGAEAIARGELAHRIAAGRGDDELAALSRRFNDMTIALEEQQNRLLGAHATLEREVVARTADLRDANDRLRGVDRMRVQFLADISHQLRTPLTVLRGDAEVALRDRSKASGEQHRAALERVAEYAGDMSRLVDDLLLLAWAEADIARFDRHEVALQDVLVAAIAEGELLAARRGLELVCEAPDEPITVVVDPHRLKQAIMIVIDNAVKYSAPGTLIRVRAASSTTHAEIVVTDSGIGVPAEDRPHVFERFYRGRGVRERGVGGTGLGLSIAKWIVEKHRGEIALTNVVPSGTEVSIRLPRPRANEAPA